MKCRLARILNTGISNIYNFIIHKYHSHNGLEFLRFYSFIATVAVTVFIMHLQCRVESYCNTTTITGDHMGIWYIGC